MKRKGGGVLKGVPTTQSVYYMWFEYLRRSQRYREVCETQGRAKDKQLNALFDDFGDIHEIAEVQDRLCVCWGVL